MLSDVDRAGGRQRGANRGEQTPFSEGNTVQQVIRPAEPPSEASDASEAAEATPDQPEEDAEAADEPTVAEEDPAENGRQR